MKAKTVLAACTILCGLMVAGLAPGMARADVGLQGPAYGAGTSGAPTTSKPESKLWFDHGSWWAVMAKPVGTNVDYHIYRLKLRPQRWVDTGVQVDTRASTRQDVLLASNGKLFIASHKYVGVSNFDSTPMAGDQMRLYRFSFSGGLYTLDPGFPTVINDQKSETLVIDADSTGALWATWVQEDSGGQHHVYVSSTGTTCVSGGACNWSAPDPRATVGADDISSLVAFGGNKIGLMWSDTSDPANGRIMFQVHLDGGTWQSSEVAVQGRKMADDHINLKSDAGRVFAVTKTKFVGASNPGTLLLRRTSGGTWSHFTVSVGALDHTRPIVLLDHQHNRIRVFEASIHNTAIFMKTAKLTGINFAASSHGARVITDTGSQMSNPTSTKQTISNATRLIVLATNPSTKRYWHAYFQIIPCIRGTSGNNTLVGTRGNDALCGLGGNDTLKGLAGKDRLVGGAGNDTFYSRDGFRDVDSGGPGHDRARVNASDVRRSIEAIF